jgi:diaminopropionate ammonia-lyase
LVLLGLGAGAFGVPAAPVWAGVARLAPPRGPATTPSGAAGLAGLIVATSGTADIHGLGLTAHSQVLLVVTEGP